MVETRRNNLFVAVIALAATISSLRNGFAYDDIRSSRPTRGYTTARGGRSSRLRTGHRNTVSRCTDHCRCSATRSNGRLAMAVQWCSTRPASRCSSCSRSWYSCCCDSCSMNRQRWWVERCSRRTPYTPNQWRTSSARRSCSQPLEWSVQRSSTCALDVPVGQPSASRWPLQPCTPVRRWPRNTRCSFRSCSGRRN